MQDPNKQNLVFFEGASMLILYARMQDWQDQHQKRLLSVSIAKDGDQFCCIALTNPSEVIICDGSGEKQAAVTGSRLWTS